MKAPKYVHDWFERAQEDIETAELLLRERGVANIICSHAQQAAEKYLKGLFAYHEKHIRKTHDLKALIATGIVFEPALNFLEKDIEFLGRFYRKSRYPDDYVQFTREDAEEALRATIRVKTFVLGKIK